MRLQRLHGFLDALALAAAHHEDGVAGGDDDEVVDPERGHRRAVGADQAVAAVDGEARALQDVAVRVRFRDLVERVQQIRPVMAGEDFGRFRLAEPNLQSMIFWVGGVPQAQYDAAVAANDISRLPSLHSPFWAPEADAVISTATEALTVAALQVLGRR